MKLEELFWLIKHYRKNRGKTIGRCIECHIIDYWPKETKPEYRLCFDCYYSNLEEMRGNDRTNCQM